MNLVREDGTFATIWRDRKTMSRVCAELERRFGLSVVHGRAGAGMPGLSRAEIERTAREGAAELDRIRLARIVRGCAAAARTEADFVQRLRRAGMMVRPRYALGGQTRVVGYSVALREPAGAPGRSGPRVWLGGGRLARDLTLTRLREHWKTSPQLEAEAVAEWSWRRGSQMPRSAAYRANSWEQAAAVVNRVRRELAAVPPDDGAVWAGAAREAAGVLSVWSMRLEVHRPGPLATAADALARSAQTPVGAPRACRIGRLRDMRGVAMVASAADAGAGERMLMRQLIRLIETIADMHQARGQARQAAALAAAARTELARVQLYRAEPVTAGPRSFTSPRPDRGIGR